MTTGSAPPPPSAMRNTDLLALKAYVQAADATQYDRVDDSLVVLDLTHSNLQQRHVEIRFGKADCLATLRERIHQKTGTPAQFQHLHVMEGEQVLGEIPPTTADTYKLGYFGLLHHGMRVHCIDTNPMSGSLGGAYEDTSLVKKYQLSDAQYEAKKDGTLRSWSRKQKEADPAFSLQRHAKQHQALMEAQRRYKTGMSLPAGFCIEDGKVVKDESVSPDDITTGEENTEFGLESVAHIQLHARCQVEPGQRRGCVQFLGQVPQLGDGQWVGVAFDEPVGQNNGTVQGVRLFDCMGERYGGLVRGKNVQTGDFPERDLLDSDDDDEL